MINPLAEVLDQDAEAFTKALLEEVEYLRYFFETADFGPAHGDVVMIINDNYGKPIPEGYEIE